MTALELCLDLSKGYASLIRRLDGRLGSFHGLSFADFAVLRELEQAEGGRLRRVDLAERLGLTPSAVTRALIPLEKIGIVNREPDQRDARVGYASLTRAGERLLKDATATAEEACQEVLELDADRFTGLAQAIGKVI